MRIVFSSGVFRKKNYQRLFNIVPEEVIPVGANNKLTKTLKGKGRQLDADNGL